MGHHAETCCISGLAIHGGTRVRYLALAQNTWQAPNHWSVSVSGRWGLRAFPIEAEYNHYGSIDEIKPGFISDLFFESLNYGIIERGVGDNSCHDVAVKRGMGRKEWLEALWEGRVVGRGHAMAIRLEEDDVVRPRWSGLGGPKAKIPKGVPTRKRIEKLIEKNGLHVSSGKYSDPKPGYVVTHVKRGYVRVRFTTFGEAEAGLTKLKPFVEEEYACMITPGTGNYADAAELLVTLKPNEDHNVTGYVRGFREKKRVSPVAQAFVREDVWQVLLGMPYASFWHDKTLLLADFIAAARKRVRDMYKSLDSLKKLRDAQNKLNASEKLDDKLLEAIQELSGLERDANDILAGSLSTREGSPPGFTLRNAWQLAIKKRPKGKDLEDLIQAVGETAHVEAVLRTIRYQWHNCGTGSQDPEHGPQTMWLTALAEIAKKEQDEWAAECGDEDSGEE